MESMKKHHKWNDIQTIRLMNPDVQCDYNFSIHSYGKLQKNMDWKNEKALFQRFS